MSCLLIVGCVQAFALLIGYLILRLTFPPRILGMLLAVAGLGSLTNSFANFHSLAFASLECT